MAWRGRKILGPPRTIEQPGPVQLPDGDPRNYNTDKLGIGAMYNERQADKEYNAANRELARMHGQLVSFSNLGPLPDYRWRAFTGPLSRAGGKISMEGEGLPQSRILAPATGEAHPELFDSATPAWVGGEDVNAALAALRRGAAQKRRQ